MPRFTFDELENAHLVRNAIYEGGPTQDFKYDPIPILVKGSNVAGFRKKKHYAVLYTSGVEPNWPDNYDDVTCRFTYHGDRRSETGDLHSTPGNRFLVAQYQLYVERNRKALLPTFIFRKADGYTPRAVQFLGLAVWGGVNIPDSDVLSTYWCHLNNRQFVNYRVIYTILNEEFISRQWINNLLNDVVVSQNTPRLYTQYIESGVYG